MVCLDVKNVKKRYGKIEALRGVSFAVSKGEIFGLLGPNGAGKTTLLKILSGITKPDEGTVNFLGVDVIREPIKIRERIGIVPEVESVPSYLTPQEYLDLICSIRGKKSDVKKYLDYFSLPNDRLARDLSKGMRQKLMIAAAVIHEPQALLLDEPLINLDPSVQKDVISLIKNFAEKGGTVILATHIVPLAQKICDRVAIMNKGKIARVLSVEDVDIEKEFFRAISSP